MAREDLNTPLHCAADVGNDGITEMLLAAGSDPDAKDIYGFTALQLVGDEPYNRALPILKRHYARSWDLESLDKAIKEKNIPLVKKMLALCPLLARLSSSRRSTALHAAAIYGQAESASLLLNAGAEVDARDKYDETPLYNTAVFGHLEAARVLIAHGARVDIFNYQGETPLYRAVQQKLHAMAALLLDRGAPIDIFAHDGRTPLSMSFTLEIAEYLLARGADVNAHAKGGEGTPLDMALHTGRKDIALLFKARGGRRYRELHLR